MDEPDTTEGAPTATEVPADAPTPIDPNFRIALPFFEGPLDLLLFLIKKHALDVLDLPIAFVAKAYTDYLGLMQKLNLDIAGEYLVMAATLAHIKSKSLLPKPPADQEDEDEDEMDPREELIRRLLEYQKYKRVAEQLGARGVAGRDVFPRGIPAPKAQGEAPLADVSVFKLIDVFQKILKRHDGQLAFEIDAEQISIQERMGQITEMAQSREKLSFEELFDGFATTYDLVVTFLALLEMAKMRILRVYQSEPDGPIYLEPRILPADETEPLMSETARSSDPVPGEEDKPPGDGAPIGDPPPDEPPMEPPDESPPMEPPEESPPAEPPVESPPGGDVEVPTPPGTPDEVHVQSALDPTPTKGQDPPR